MAKERPPRPEPTDGTPYDTYLVPRSKTPAKNALYDFLFKMGWRFDHVTTTWWTPEKDTYQAFGRLEYDRGLDWARIQPPNDPGSTVRKNPILKLSRTNTKWAVRPDIRRKAD